MSIIKKLLQCIVIIAPLLWIGCSTGENGGETSASAQKYTCPMHPQVISAEPSTCPVCAMDLVPVSASGEGNQIMLSASQIQLANIRTTPVKSDMFETSKVLNGRILSNENMAELVSSRYAGRVEKIYVKETGRLVKKGQPLFEIYSEEVQTLQQDYLLQFRQMAAFPDEKIYRTLFEAAENKLKLLGYSPSQIQHLRKKSEPSPLVTVYAAASGTVSEINLTEGQYVAEGTPVMRLESLAGLWLEADVYPEEARSIRIGMQMMVSVNGLPDIKEPVKIDFIAPQVDPSSQIVKIRGTIRNNGSLLPGMQASVLLPGEKGVDGIALPLDAVVREEAGSHVWIKTGKDTFEPRRVTTGSEDETQIIILKGLENATEVVTAGAYLLTSEFILKKGRNPMDIHQH